MKKLSEQITQIFNSNQEEVTLKTLLESIDERAFGVIIAIIALPSSIPIIPGYSAFFSVFLLILTIQLLFNRPYPWFPARFLNTKLGNSTEDKTVSIMLKVLHFLEKFTSPRLTFLYRNRLSEMALSVVMILCSISMISPLPATGTIPALAIFLIAFGMIQDDGIFAILGIFVAIIGLALSIAVHAALIIGGQAAIDQLLNLLKLGF